MAKIKVEDVIDHLDRELRRALEATIKKHFPNQEFDKRAIFKTFKREAYRKCNTWENVPDKFVKMD